MDRLCDRWNYVFGTAEPQFPGRGDIANGEESVCERGIADHKRRDSENQLAQQNAVSTEQYRISFLFMESQWRFNTRCSFEDHSLLSELARRFIIIHSTELLLLLHVSMVFLFRIF